jgi:hypothetical protein
MNWNICQGFNDYSFSGYGNILIPFI